MNTTYYSPSLKPVEKVICAIMMKLKSMSIKQAQRDMS